MKPLHVSSSRSKGSERPLLPLQAAGGGGAGAGGGKKGYSSGDGSSSSSGGGGGLWESYNQLLQQYPLLVKAITTAVLSAVGNLICQFLVEGKSELDWRRFNTFTALGFVWVAPCLHFWFGTLNRLVTNPGNMGALMRMGLDQLGFAPLFISSMIAILAALDGKSMDQSVAVVKRDLPDAIKANWALWVPAQFINFRWGWWWEGGGTAAAGLFGVCSVASRGTASFSPPSTRWCKLGHIHGVSRPFLWFLY
jgi:hypothetical protein